MHKESCFPYDIFVFISFVLNPPTEQIALASERHGERGVLFNVTTELIIGLYAGVLT